MQSSIRRRPKTSGKMLFKDAAQRFLDLHLNEWKNAKHRQQWQNSLKTYAYPSIGNRPIAAIDGAVITEALSPIWTKKPETARRVKQRIESVIQWVRDGRRCPCTGQASGCGIIPPCHSASFPTFMAKACAAEQHLGTGP